MLVAPSACKRRTSLSSQLSPPRSSRSCWGTPRKRLISPKSFRIDSLVFLDHAQAHQGRGWYGPEKISLISFCFQVNTFKQFINPKTRNAPPENVVERKKKVDVVIESKSEAQSDKIAEIRTNSSTRKDVVKEKISKDTQNVKVQGPKSTESDEEKLKARLKQFGSNISFSSEKWE